MRVKPEAGAAWTSDLSAAEFVCLKSVGFDPVGQVAGSSVVLLDRERSWFWCSYRRGERSAVETLKADPLYVHQWYQERRVVTGRMVEECKRLGGDGVVGIRLEVEPFLEFEGAMRFQVVGTAVRARGLVRPPKPFLTDLGGQEFALLVGAGWIPVDMVIGLSIAAVHDPLRNLYTPRAEMDHLNGVVALARENARRRFDVETVRSGADGALLSRQDMRVWGGKCPRSRSDGHMFVETLLVGSAITRFRRPTRPTFLESAQRILHPRPSVPAPRPKPPARTLSIMRMNDGGEV